MRQKKWIIFLGVLLVIAVAVMAYAAQTQKPAMKAETGTCPAPAMGQGMGMMRGPMMGQDKGMMCSPMCPMMGGGMMGRTSMVAMGNNLYVLHGRTIMKFDRDLNLVKEAEIKMDMEKMKKMGEDMMQMCPMQEKMREKPMEQKGTMKY